MTAKQHRRQRAGVPIGIKAAIGVLAAVVLAVPALWMRPAAFPRLELAEYRISEDGGETFSPVYDLEYSKDVLLEGVYVISVEKAVACEDGTIIAFCLRSDNRNLYTVARQRDLTCQSHDNGRFLCLLQDLTGYAVGKLDIRSVNLCSCSCNSHVFTSLI